MKVKEFKKLIASISEELDEDEVVMGFEENGNSVTSEFSRLTYDVKTLVLADRWFVD